MNKRKIDNFLDRYAHLYPDYLKSDFKKKIYDGYTINNDVINQIYCFLELVNIKKTDYYIFYKYLKEHNFLSENILEVGCGLIPILSRIVYDEGYNITALDKNIIFDDFGFHVIEKELSDSFSYSNYSSIIAFRPCMATETTIRNCLKNNIPFCIYLCSCSLYPQEPYKEFDKKDWSNKKWIAYLMHVVDKYNEHDMIVKLEYDTGLFDECPIIYGKVTKKQES